MLRGFKYYLSPNEGTGGSNPPTPPAGSGSGNPPATPPTDTQDVASLPDWAQKVIRETREDAAKHRISAKDRDALATKLKEIEDAQLSEADKVNKTAQEATDRATSLESQLRSERLTLAIEREARQLNIVDPETAALIIGGKTDTGNLVNSIRVAQEITGISMVVAVNAEYGEVLEFGGVHMEARPFLAPALESQREEFRKRCEKGLR